MSLERFFAEKILPELGKPHESLGFDGRLGIGAIILAIGIILFLEQGFGRLLAAVFQRIRTIYEQRRDRPPGG